MTSEGVNNLKKAIVLQACIDYGRLYKKIFNRQKLNALNEKEYNNLCSFFLGEYIQMLTDIDGSFIMKTIERRIENGEDFKISK